MASSLPPSQDVLEDTFRQKKFCWSYFMSCLDTSQVYTSRWETWFHQMYSPLIHHCHYSFPSRHYIEIFSNSWCLLTISRNVESLILTHPSGPMAKTGPWSQASAGWQTKNVISKDPNCSRPATAFVVTAPVQRRTQRNLSNLRRSVFQFRYLLAIMLFILISLDMVIHIFISHCRH